MPPSSAKPSLGRVEAWVPGTSTTGSLPDLEGALEPMFPFS